MTPLERLVGRDAVLVMARGALDEALAGTAQLVLITGEAGIGKTAVLNRLAEDATGRGALVLRATCWDGGAPAYWPWIQALRAVDPELFEQSGIQVTTGAEAADARFRLFDATARLLTKISQDTGVVVVLDDLHWADDASIRMLEFLARHLGMSRVLLLGAYREADMSLLASVGQRFELLGLDASEVAAVMTAIASAPPDDLARQVWQRSGGNPLFVRELTRLIAARGTADQIPQSVRDTLRGRLARLSQPCADLLAAAAVCGRTLRIELLSLVAGTADPELLDEAINARVLTSDLRFSHDLFRETLLAEQPARRLAELHKAAGDALDTLREKGSPVTAAEVAAHFLAAGPSAAAEAVRYCTLAGHEASARLAHSDAAAHFRNALTSLDLLDAPDGRRDLLVCLAEALDRAGDADNARECYRDLADLAARLDDPRALAEAALGLHGLGFRAGTVDTLHLRLLAEAVDTLPSSEPALRSRVLAALARDLRHGPKPDAKRAIEIAAEASALARSTGDPSVLAFSLLAEHDVTWQRDNAIRRLAILSEMDSAAERANDPDMVAQTVLLRATALIELGNPEGLTQLHTYIRLADGLGHARGRYGALTRRATVAAITGPSSEAIALSEEAVALGVMISQPDAFAVYGTLSFSLSVLGVDVGLEIEINPADPIAPMVPVLRAAGMVAAGSLTLAAETFADFAVTAIPEQPHPELYGLTAFVAAAVGSDEQRSQIYQRLSPLAGQHIVVGGCASYTGAVDYHLGRLSAALGRHEDAVRHLTAAIAMHERLGAHPWADLSRLALAGLHCSPAETFHRDGPLWTLSYRGSSVQLPHAKGLADIAHLLAAPRQDVHAFDLLGRGPAVGADPILDDAARQAYKTRLAHLDAAIDASPDPARLEAERDELIHQLTAAAGLGGRPRRLGDDTERARKTVTARIRDTLDRIDQAHPLLAAHLRATIRTGTYCRYDPPDDIHWRL